MSEATHIWIDRLLKFMADPASYPHNPENVEIVQTHISIVAIAPPFVYKVKKPVNLGFLDFSTQNKREFFCNEEIRLNSRMTHGVYLGVEPISDVDGSLEYGSTNVVDYAVKMRLLDDEYFLHHLSDEGNLTSRELELVANRLAKFYLVQQPNPEIAQWGRVERIQISTTENFEQIHGQIGVLLTQPAFETLVYFTDRFYDVNARLLVKRRSDGHIKDCHGDLHLDHIHIQADDVSIYDCIEFNERFRYIDVANDVAFLAMDLDYHGRRDLSESFELSMAEALGDSGLSTLLPFYKCYRAIVRGKVAGMRGMEKEIPASDRKDAIDEGRSYYQLALDYAVTNDRPTVIVVMGGVGTGKSSQAAALEYNLGWDTYSSDAVRKGRSNNSIHERTPDDEREALYLSEVTNSVYKELADKAVESVRSGRSCIIDATYGRRRQRDQLRDILTQEEIEYRFVEVTAPDELIRERLTNRATESDVVSDARLEDYEKLSSNYEHPTALEDPYHFTVSSAGTANATVSKILKVLVQLS